jgi:hypothetical protein
MMSRRASFIVLAIAGAMLMLDIALMLFGADLGRLVANARYGCFPWSPPIVEYRPGMTLCPGQSAHATIIIEIGPRDGGGI